MLKVFRVFDEKIVEAGFFDACPDGWFLTRKDAFDAMRKEETPEAAEEVTDTTPKKRGRPRKEQ
jgi:hypothetical protein